MSHALSALMAHTAQAVAPDTDGQLLRRFVRTGDEAAFAELVRRLGPLVLGVCRRIAPDAHTAEDAFQAAFLVLARRAAVVRPAEAVRGWLYGVAVRCAQEARTVSARRRAREVPVPNVPEQPAEPNERADADVLHALDEEMTLLPEHLRAAVVLCEIEGLSRKEAAGRLRTSEGTLSSRLAKARKLLAHRLRQRGITLSSAGLSAALGATAQARVPTDLTARALTAALFPALRPAGAITLSTRVLKTMLVQKLKTVVPLVALALGAFACAALAATQEPPGSQPRIVPATRPDSPAVKVAPKPLLKGPNKLLYWTDGKLVLSNPDGKNTKEFALKERFLPSVQLSPDGKTIAYRHPPQRTAKLSDLLTKSEPLKLHLHVRALNDTGSGTDLGVECDSFVWSPDGTEIACSSVDDEPGRQPQATSLVVRVESKEKTELKLPPGHVITSWAPDGRFVTMRLTRTDPSDAKARLYLVNRDGSKHKALAPDTNATMGRMSPDGTRVLCVLLKSAKETTAEKKKRQEAGAELPPPERALAILDIASGKVTKVANVPPNGEVQEHGLVWSPDGKRIAYTWRQKHEGGRQEATNKETEWRLIVCDADGTNVTTVASQKTQGELLTLFSLDWR
ncbi:ECF RNA polymerase sigma factor SigE [Gemmata obscuriglobus]|uniref:Sigma-70 family RNA polymerase sigma factor n=1 Tax=Gemmata obscuriglobus TaxID=114 RepID=A0A2Z3H8Y2_9BACT|nr:sigma-70 family RNA polymerase sigma factor [Gemmata obscuriglobus]AWM41341.1 hypothetical protein C1280_32985 [Gemmata obscuriglobus]QEG25306.1 ECF RNA polymerase sigma factor SigE [Gemmata obscuriglobus]VTR98180.1 sigma-70 family rna polymerase sigma factor : RNA polymerase sigma factor, sigma-70 family OS=Singulisphaera acidiphila (strain ATCC BAA-1392 / DSM 18658 / VKM B-2454 / MOB10) GN=Sinac_4264 PE=4 SV=1: Sigma70_r2: Sigma70_r4_2: PD40 [Gemmata obscuriglobus UQM 2246]